MFHCATAIGCGDERWVVPLLPDDAVFRVVHSCSIDTAAGVVIQCLQDVNEPVRNAVVCQNFPQGWPVYTVKCLFKIDEVNDEVLLMLEALFRVNICSVHERPFLKPACSSCRVQSTASCSLFRNTLLKTL